MRIDPVVALTLMLLSILVAATSVSLSWGYALGRNALKGVTQPDVRPTTSSISGEPEDGEAPRDMVFWSETEIIEDSKSRIQSAN
ncbi:MAG: hypothetical protein AAGD25_30685 [Cyanobacteria bacterium P01_F01_bin.150]